MLCDRCPVCPVCDIGVLWPNSWMDQDETWHGDGPQPGPHCVRCGGGAATKRNSLPILGPCLLWLNSWMDQDSTRYGDMPRPSGHYV